MFGIVSFLWAQEEPAVAEDSLATENKITYTDNVLFKDNGLFIFRRRDNLGNDAVQVAFGNTPPIEISKDGSIRANRFIVSNQRPVDDYSTENPYLQEVDENSIDLVQNQKKLEQQIRDLTALVNSQNKYISSQNQEIADLKKEIKKIKIVLVNQK